MLFFLNALASDVKSAVVLQDNLIQPYTQALQSAEPFDPPYYSKFEKGKHSLVYLAVSTQKSAGPKTHELFDKLIDSFRPQAIVYQGYIDRKFEASVLCSSELVIFDYLECVALKKKIVLLKAEPSDEALDDHSKKLGLTAEDFFYFYVFRPLASSKEPLNIENTIAAKSKQLAFLKKEFNKAGFLAWYSKNSKKPFSFQELSSNDFAPFENGTALQQISAKIDRHREAHILAKIESALNQYSDVLVVYSFAHLPKHRRSLENFFGKTQNQQPSIGM